MVVNFLIIQPYGKIDSNTFKYFNVVQFFYFLLHVFQNLPIAVF